MKINLDDITEAMKSSFDGMDGGFFLDTETGKILLSTEGLDNGDLPEDLENNPRYRAIDLLESNEAFQIMEDFIDSLGDTEESYELADALNRQKPFRQFKDTLCNYPDLREAWFEFEKKELARLAKEWCEANGIVAAGE